MDVKNYFNWQFHGIEKYISDVKNSATVPRGTRFFTQYTRFNYRTSRYLYIDGG
ncbi:hypothetical protein [Staphylococcus xylosus]|uniref:hypothetical protein n=1 Tax=Staphylococcus xylosus TaxID=1288 RepID=UPI00159F2A21|nr:hypothetical protein [Staphylococcus xylosus]